MEDLGGVASNPGDVEPFQTHLQGRVGGSCDCRKLKESCS